MNIFINDSKIPTLYYQIDFNETFHYIDIRMMINGLKSNCDLSYYFLRRVSYAADYTT